MVTATDSLLKQRYLKKVLMYEGLAIRKDQQAKIGSEDLYQTGAMERTISVDVVQADYTSGDLELSFVKYLRFLDIKPKSKLSKYKRKGAKRTTGRKKSYGLYNRIVFGHFNNIISKLAYGYTEEVKAKLRAEINIELEG